MQGAEGGLAGVGGVETTPVETDITIIPGVSEPEGTDTGTPDYEKLAAEQGWKPKEGFTGEVTDFVNAEEFVKRRPLFDKIKNQSKKIANLEKTVEGISKHYSESVKQAKEQAIAELTIERREAIQLGNVKEVEALDTKIAEVNKIEEPVAAVPSLPEPIEKFLDEQKSWFNANEEMTNLASNFNAQYLKKNPGKLEESLGKTLEMIKRVYPEHFENTRRAAPPTVEGGGEPPANPKGKYSLSRLSTEQRLVHDALTKNGRMKSDEYFKQLETAGFLG